MKAFITCFVTILTAILAATAPAAAIGSSEVIFGSSSSQKTETVLPELGEEAFRVTCGDSGAVLRVRTQIPSQEVHATQVEITLSSGRVIFSGKPPTGGRLIVDKSVPSDAVIKIDYSIVTHLGALTPEGGYESSSLQRGSVTLHTPKCM